MGNYEQLKKAVSAVIKTNGNQEITGEVMKSTLLSIISTVSNDATFAGMATPETNPGTQDQNVFYLACENGAYVNFSSIINVYNNEVIILYNKDGVWKYNRSGIGSEKKQIELYNEINNINNDFILTVDALKTKYGNAAIKNIYIENVSLSENERIVITTFVKNEDGTFRLTLNKYNITTQQSELLYINQNLSNGLKAGVIELLSSRTKKNKYIGAIYIDSNSYLGNITNAGEGLARLPYLSKKCFNVEEQNIIQSSDIYEKINDLNNIVKNETIISLPNTQYVNYDNGNLVAGGNNWICSDIVNVQKGDVIHLNLYGNNIVATVACYNNGVYLKEKSTNENFIERYFVVPDGINKIRVCGQSDSFGNYSHYAYKQTTIKNLSDEIVNIQETINDDLCTSEDAIFVKGYLKPNGSIGSTTDTNWIMTDFYDITLYDQIIYSLIATTLIGNVCFYDSDKIYMPEPSISGVNTNSDERKIILNDIIKQYPNVSFFKLCGKSSTFGSYEPYAKLLTSVSKAVSEIKGYIDTTKISDLIFPKSIYITCANNIYDDNVVPTLYLDHFVKTKVTKEYDLKFEENNSKQISLFPKISGINPSWNGNINNGLDKINYDKTISISGNNVKKTERVIKVFSTKKSVGENKKVFLLVIGDSITWGEGATINIIGTSSDRKPYHSLGVELFMKDKIDNYNMGYDFVTIGTQQIKSKFTYKNNNYDYVSNHNGVRGISMSQVLNGGIEALKDDLTNKFSVKALIDKYRTLSDDGVRLEVGSGTGTEITSENIDVINVCTPTHVLIALGTNGGYTKEQLQEMIDIIKDELPNTIIGITIPDSAGTIFPTYYNCQSDMIRWMSDDNIGERHDLQSSVQEIINEFDSDEYRSQNIYTLPFFFTHNPLSFSTMPIYTPNGEAQLQQFGWKSAVHVSMKAHYDWAYQLYSWIKYTI